MGGERKRLKGKTTEEQFQTLMCQYIKSIEQKKLTQNYRVFPKMRLVG